jgi:hypothetical protein
MRMIILNGKPKITQIIFDEGVFDLIWCVIAQTDYEDIVATFECFICINNPWVNFADNVSEKLRKFDETSIYAYAEGIEEFESWFVNGGWDFKILDYEKEENADT